MKDLNMQKKVPMERSRNVRRPSLHRFLFESFMNNNSGNYFSARRLDNKKVLITFQSEEEMTSSIVQHNEQSFYWFRSVEPWSGDVVQIEEDTAKSARFDVGKVKVFTREMSTINQVMHLMVGSKLYFIRVAEEQAVFICNSDFRCGCICHGKEEEETPPPLPREDDDDVAGVGDAILSAEEDIDSRSFIAESQEVGEENRVGDGSAPGAGFEDSRGYALNYIEEDNTATHSLETYLGLDRIHIDRAPRSLGEEDFRGSSLDLEPSGFGGLESMGPKDPSGESQNPTVEPVNKSRLSGEMVFKPDGINLEVVLVGDSTLMNTTATMPELQGRRSREDEGLCLSKEGVTNRQTLEVADLEVPCRGTEASRKLQIGGAQQVLCCFPMVRAIAVLTGSLHHISYKMDSVIWVHRFGFGDSVFRMRQVEGSMEYSLTVVLFAFNAGGFRGYSHFIQSQALPPQ
ncbi:hypothetical protein Dimus_005649 [Dionaea muscipula]